MRWVKSTGTSRWTPLSCAHISTRRALVLIHRRGPPQKGAETPERQNEAPWPALYACLAQVVREVRAWVAHAAGSPPSSN